MVRELMTLPLRIGVRATRLGLRVTGQAVSVAWKATERLIGRTAPEEEASERSEASATFSVDVVVAPPPIVPAPSDLSPAPPERALEGAPAPETRPEESPPPAAAAEAPPAPATRPATSVPPAPAETVSWPTDSRAHVSEEPQLVEAFAEPGAEEGAGASVHVREPWEGYGRMTADAVIARLTDAGPEELAAVELYERAHRCRHTILAAAERQLRRETAAAPNQAAITQNG